MPTIQDFDRNAFAEVGTNAFIEYTDEEFARLAQIAAELRKISKAALERSRKAS